jgi:hypothetical protein
MMNADEEIVVYLRGLFDHHIDCPVANCPTCTLVRELCESIRQRIFGYPAVPLKSDPILAPPRIAVAAD